MKPKLKPPGTKRLKLKCDILLSTSALKFNLRRYSKVKPWAGRCRLNVSKPVLKAPPGFSARNYNMMKCFQTLLSVSACAATPGAVRTTGNCNRWGGAG